MDFLADENVSRHVISCLRAAGHDVAAIGEVRAGIPDREVLATADSSGRLLITEDRDFGDLVIRQGLPVRGVMLLRLDTLTNEAEAARVIEVVEQHAGVLDGHLVVVEPGRIRRRPLSVESEPRLQRGAPDEG